MKKLLATLALVSWLHAESDNALFDLNLDDVFASAPVKMSSVGGENLIMSGFSFGYISDDNQRLYATKGGALTQADSLNTPSPTSYVLAYEQLGYEYISDFGTFVNLGLVLPQK